MLNDVTIQGEIISIVDERANPESNPMVSLLIECERDSDAPDGSRNVDVFKARAYGVKAQEIQSRVVRGEIVTVTGALRSLWGQTVEGKRHMYAEIEIRRYYTASGRG